MFETPKRTSIRASHRDCHRMMTTARRFLRQLFKRKELLIQWFLLVPVIRLAWNWLAFAAYSLVVLVLFAVLFKHKHTAADLENVHH